MKKEEKNIPEISIVVPVFNDPQGIKVTLESLVTQDYNHDDFEIIIADNGSTDNTLTIVKRFIKEYPTLVRCVVENTLRSSYAARNKGIKASRGSIIAFIDSDMSVDRDWLQKIKQSLGKYKAEYLACGIEIYSQDRSIFSLYNKVSGFPVKEYVKNRHFGLVGALAIKKCIFDELGLFDADLISSGDYEFGNRVYDSGRRLYYDLSIVMRHPARSSFRQFFQKSFRIGRGFYQLSIYYPELYRRMYKNSFSGLRRPSKESWNLFTFDKKSKDWSQLTSVQKIGLYVIDIINKLIKPLGFMYEKLTMRENSVHPSHRGKKKYW